MDANVQARLDEIESAFVETETMLSHPEGNGAPVMISIQLFLFFKTSAGLPAFWIPSTKNVRVPCSQDAWHTAIPSMAALSKGGASLSA